MSMEQVRSTSYLCGGNAPYIEDQYEQYLANPARVEQEWRDYFDARRDRSFGAVVSLPADMLASELARHPHARVVVWCQEEARNQGAWCKLEHQLQAVARPVPLQYAGPAAAASTSPGCVSVHQANQRALVTAAFEG
jgi:2-oxoglutarate dehydrogenase complex dehydrogenase (E1) component-like enzyme